MGGVWWCQTLLFAALALFSLPKSFGVVEIIEKRSPELYQVGDLLELQCFSNDRKGLYWTRESPATRWKEQRIEITKDSNWEERYLTIRPKGYVESILIRRELESGDGGSYHCYDGSKEHSFSTFIHVLKVSYKNVTAHNSTAVSLTCNLSGFTTNPPRIDHSWVHEDVELVPGGRPHKYQISTLFGTSMKLDILKPSKADTGVYICNFILYQKNDNYVIFTEHVYLDANHLEGSANKVWSSVAGLIGLLCLAIHCL